MGKGPGLYSDIGKKIFSTRITRAVTSSLSPPTHPLEYMANVGLSCSMDKVELGSAIVGNIALITGLVVSKKKGEGVPLLQILIMAAYLRSAWRGLESFLTVYPAVARGVTCGVDVKSDDIPSPPINKKFSPPCGTPIVPKKGSVSLVGDFSRDIRSSNFGSCKT